MFIEGILLTSIIFITTFVLSKLNVCRHYKLPSIYFKDTTEHRELIDSIGQLKQPFIPTYWASSCHFQTWLKTALRFFRPFKLNVSRENLEMNDKGIVSLDWVNIERANKAVPKKSRIKSTRTLDRPILLIIPSSINTSINNYTDLCVEAITNGFLPVVFNRRGYSSTPLTTPKISTYCDTSDLHEALAYITSQCPFSDIVAIAFSIESANLISYLGHKGNGSCICGAVCVSSTFGCENLLNDHALKEPYNFIITEKLKTTLLRQRMLDLRVDVDEAKVCKNIVELQGAIHARTNHYKTLKQYLQYNNPLAYLNKVSVPTLFLHAKDDPVIPDLCIPLPFFQISDSCVLAITESGGHCGFFEDFVPNCWSDSVAIDFFKSILYNRKIISTENGLPKHRRVTTGSFFSSIGV